MHHANNVEIYYNRNSEGAPETGSTFAVCKSLINTNLLVNVRNSSLL